MTAIGGFFGLELGAGGREYHEHALAMASGRACLRRIVERIRPARVWTPFYVCDVVLRAIEHAGAAIDLYAIDETLAPVLPDGLGKNDAVLYVNYFGANAGKAVRVADSFGAHAIIDDTQAFFQKGYAGAWSFNSARKFFGVPDGAYAYGDSLSTPPLAEPRTIRFDYLVSRALGRQEQAFEQYKQSEACVNDEPVAMSRVSQRLLAGVDAGAARHARERNFLRLHQQLAARNRLPLDSAAATAGPYCYPLLTASPVPWERLWARELFAPRLWPELETRPAASQFTWECHLASHLLPLPIDHRYADADMDRVAAIVAEVMGW